MRRYVAIVAVHLAWAVAAAASVAWAGWRARAEYEPLHFPRGFMLGAATASYQVEGGWNASHKGESVWDHATHQHPEWFKGHETGDVGPDSYHQYKQDVAAVAAMGLTHYRFSISWPRILPDATTEQVDEDGMRYYNHLIDELLHHNITPVVSMFHWDLPQIMQDLGGWPNPLLADYFVDYAGILFKLYGDRVKWWITFNEPTNVCRGYADAFLTAPKLSVHGLGDYLCGHTIIKAHARVYHLYKRDFYKLQKGKIGISLNANWYEPQTTSPKDLEASNLGLQFLIGWFANPIFSQEGDYPEEMRRRVDYNCAKEGRTRSRLPYFTKQWVKFIQGTADFFALNHYTTRLVIMNETGPSPSRSRDSGITAFFHPSWPKTRSQYFTVVPWGFRKTLNWVKAEYNNIPVFVTENGFADDGRLHDTARVGFLANYIQEMLKAIHYDGCNVIGYTAWSLIDNFEWFEGYNYHFGLYGIDYSVQERTRIPKLSARVYAEIKKKNYVPAKYLNITDNFFS